MSSDKYLKGVDEEAVKELSEHYGIHEDIARKLLEQAQIKAAKSMEDAILNGSKAVNVKGIL